MFFTSDNSSGVAPEILAALTAANSGYQPSYGNDDLMPLVQAQIREIFEAPEAVTYLVATGTTANSLSLALNCPPWGAVLCHTHAHIQEDECGAPEFFTNGAKLVLVEGEHGKMTPEALRRTAQSVGRVGVHSVQHGMVSITNITEAGTLYRAAEVKALCDVAREFNMPVHMDGARFANAVAASGDSPADLTWRAGVDILSFGGTKNGCMGVEAVVIFNPAKAWEFELRRKRAGHLFSKHRYLSAQFHAYLQDGLWLELAKNANAQAAKLAQALAQDPRVTLRDPVDGNILFAHWPTELGQALQAKGARYYGDPIADAPHLEEARLVTSWCSSDAEITAFINALDSSS